jgi:hypothetical protein
MAVDVVPVDETADPETWQGDWVEKRWTPLSRAIDRGLDAIVILFRDALHAAKHGQAPPSPVLNNSTAKSLQPQSRPPVNNITNMMANMDMGQQQQQLHHSSHIHGGPSTSSVEAGSKFLGGRLDYPSKHDDEGPYETDQEKQRLEQQMHGTNRSNMNSNMNSNMVPMGPPPSIRDRMVPGGSVTGKSKQPAADSKGKDRSSHHRRDRESSRDRDSSRHRGHRERDSSRRHRSDRYEDEEEEERDRDRDRHRSGHREHRERDRSASKDRRRHREHSRDREREREKDRGRSSGRVYENTENDDRDYSMDRERDGDYKGFSSGPSKGGDPSKRMPTEQPPKSLLEAASSRPFSRYKS